MVWQSHEWYEFTLLSIAIFFGRYALIPGLFYLVLWKAGKEKWSSRKIQPEFPDRKTIREEVLWSIVSLSIFVLVSLLVYFLFYQGYTTIYLDTTEYGWAYFVISIFIMIVIHDTYFYWTHRLMHIDFLFENVHSVHHRFTNPTPWSSFAFHPLEALVEVGIVVLIVLILPSHPLAIAIFLLYMTILNVLGHSGYELFPPGYVDNWFWRLHNTSTHHNMHHQYMRCNYGIYFNVWDKLMGTNHPEYLSTFREVSRQ